MSGHPSPNAHKVSADAISIMVESEYWKFICSELTDEDVRSIAAADNENGYDDNHAEIRRLLSADTSGFKLECYLQEGLELTRWHIVINAIPSVQQTAGNRRRAFAAAALLIAHCVPINECRLCSINESLAVLMVSHTSLGWQRWSALDDFLANLEGALLPEFDDEMAFVCLARGILASQRGPQYGDDAAIFFHRAFAAAWWYRKESPEMCTWENSPWSWVLQTTFFTQRISFWQSLLEQSSDSARRNNFQPVIIELIKLRDAWDFHK